MKDEHRRFMKLAIAEACKAAARGEVPVGAVAVEDGKVIGTAHNLKETTGDPTAHAELLLIRELSKSKGDWRLTDVVIYTTLEPCIMCTGAMVHARIKACCYGACDPKFGGSGSLYDIPADPRLNHRFPCTGGILAQEIAEMMRDFFKARR